MAKDIVTEILERQADFENRISFLENSLPGSAMIPRDDEAQENIVTPEKPWTRRQWDRVEQLQGEMANLKRKFLELEKQIPKRTRKGKYD